MRGTTFIDVGVLSRRRVRELLEIAKLSFDIEVTEDWGLLRSRFYVTFDGKDAYRAYKMLRRACERG